MILRSLCVVAVSFFVSAASAQVPIGFQAELSDLSTVGISGTVTITGPNTLRFDNFSYDGRGGGLTELRLLPTAAAAAIVPPDSGNSDESRLAILNTGVPLVTLRGDNPNPGIDASDFPDFFAANPGFPSTAGGGDAPPILNFSGEVNIPTAPGVSLTDFAGISVFCIPFMFDFGSGIFTSPADFENNGIVNAADFTVLRDTVGAQGINVGQLGDGTSDGQVTAEDFDAFFAAFGTVAPAAELANAALIDSLLDHSPPAEVLAAFDAPSTETATAATIPEPAGVALALLAASAFAVRRRGKQPVEELLCGLRGQ